MLLRRTTRGPPRPRRRFREHFGDRRAAVASSSTAPAPTSCRLQARLPRRGRRVDLRRRRRTSTSTSAARPRRWPASSCWPSPTPDGKLDARARPAAAGARSATSTPSSRGSSRSASRTELGTVYTADEIRALADVAHAHGLLLHVDGARLANAAAALGADAARAHDRRRRRRRSRFGGTKAGAARRRGGRLPARRACGRRLRVPAQAVDAARVEDALPRRPSSTRCSATTCGGARPGTPTRWRARLAAARGRRAGRAAHPAGAGQRGLRDPAARRRRRGCASDWPLLHLGRGDGRGALDVRVGHAPEDVDAFAADVRAVLTAQRS